MSEIAEKSVIAHSRKAARTYESICLHIQENFQITITRKSVANHFGLASNHVSRLFRREGADRFSDYLNLMRMNRAKFMFAQLRLGSKTGSSQLRLQRCRVFLPDLQEDE